MLLTGIVHGILIGSVYALLTLGFAVIRSVSGILNFAHGQLVVLAMYIAIVVHRNWGLDPYVAAVVVVPVMFVLGVLLYLLVFRRLVQSHVLVAVQATLGIAFVIEGLTLMTQGGQNQSASSVVDGESMTLLGVRVEVGDVVAFILSTLTAVVLFVVLTRTQYGRDIRAVHQNPRGAVLVGVSVGRVQTLTFGLGLALAGMAGVLLLPGASIHASQGIGFTVTAILAYFIGQGHLLGVIGGGLILGLAETLGTLYLPGSYGFILPYIVVFVILLRPQGLFTRTGSAA